jgi:hypothetical protein
MPWLTFVLIGAGVAVAAVALAGFLLGRVSGATLAGAGAAVVIVGAILSVFPLTKDSVEAINRFRLDNRGTPPDQAREKCLVDGGARGDVPLARLARATVPANARYQFIGPVGVDRACWATNLMPRLLRDTVRTGDWLLFTDGVPPAWRARVAPGSLRTAGGKLAVGQVR